MAGIFTVPVLLSRLGPTEFGIYVIAQTIVSYAALAQFGMASGFVQGYSAAFAGGSDATSEGLLGTGLVVLGLLGAGLLVVVASLSGVLAGVFNVPMNLKSQFQALVAGAMIAYGLGLVQAPFSGLLSALERVDLVAKINLASILLGAVLSVTAVLLGGGLGALAVVMVVTSFTTLVTFVVLTSRAQMRVRLTGATLEAKALRFLWRYGVRIQVLAVSGLVNRSIDRIWLGALRSPTAVAQYDVADRAAYSLVFSAAPMQNALFPRFAALSASTAGGDEQRRLYHVATSLSSYMSSGLGLAAVALAPVLLHAWLGAASSASEWALRLLAVGYAVNVTFVAADVSLRAQQVPRLAARAGATLAIVNVVASLLGVHWFGVVGAAGASALCGGGYAVILSLLVERRILGTRLGTGLGVAARRWLPNLVAAAVTSATLLAVGRATGDLDRLGAFVALLLGSAVFVVVSVTVACGTRSMPEPLARRARELFRLSSAKGKDSGQAPPGAD